MQAANARSLSLSDIALSTEFLRKVHLGAAIVVFIDISGFKVQSLPGVKTIRTIPHL